MGGGLIKFPHENLREVEIDGDGAEGGGGGEDTSEDAFLFQVLTIINSTEGFYFDEDSDQGFVFPISDWDDSWSEGSTLLGNKETADYVISGYNDDITYYIFITADELNILEELYYPYKNYYVDWRKNQFAFPIESVIHVGFSDDTPYINYTPTLNNSIGCLFDNSDFASSILFGIEDDSKLHPEGEYSVVSPKFSFRPDEGGSGFVYMNHKYIQSNYTQEGQDAIYNLFESFNQHAYLASSTEYCDIYIVRITLRISNFRPIIHTPYVVRKQE